MKIMKSEWRDRIRNWVRSLQMDLYRPLGEIRFEAARTMQYLTPEEAKELSFQPVTEGFTWGKTWEYCWFRSAFALPKEAAGKRIVMNLKPGGESTLFVNGRCFGAYRSDWIEQEHQFFEDNTLVSCAQGQETFELYMETYAGHFYPGGSMGTCATGPVLPETCMDLLAEGSRRVLGKSTFGIWNEDAYQLLMDADTLLKLLETLEPSSLRAAKICDALETFTLCADFEQGEELRNASYRKAREILRPALEAVNGSTMPVFYAIGNAHLDLAWLWPMEETCRKTARTFAAQLRLLEEYPQYRFLQSQPAAYEMCRQHYPELFERIVVTARSGQWIAEGAMWVEPDTNMAGGEALVRQILYGKKYYRETFGVDSVVLWLPDTFGYSAVLPQLLKKSGVKYLVTQKIFWSYNEGETFPYHYFYWEGLDGSKITAFLPTSYTYPTDPGTICDVWKKRSQERNLEAFLYPFGYGDGGGGPARDHVEYLLREKNLEGMPGVRMESPVTFFEEMEAAGGPENTYAGELYFNAHRGTFTTQAKMKLNNRRAETALHNMELWGAIAMTGNTGYDGQASERLWKELLLHQFHDILPGSGIKKVYEDAGRRMEALLREVQELTESCIHCLCTGKEDNAVTVCNALSFVSTQVAELPVRFADGAVDETGKHLPVWTMYDGSIHALVSVPSLGMRVLYPAVNSSDQKKTGISADGIPQQTESVSGEEQEDRANEKGREGWGARIVRTDDGYRMENEKIAALVDLRGEVRSLVLKSSGMECAKAPMNHFRLFKDVPRRFDAWDIDSNYELSETEGAYDIRTDILQSSPEAVLRVCGKIGNSSYVQKITLAPGSDRITFETEADWDELHRLWKVAFPTTIHTTEGYNEIQFGYIRRPATRSDTWDRDRYEVCNHRYSALCDEGNGAAVLNDCKYGISMKDGAMELTLLRAAASPEMRTDRGHHTFTYALMLWEGSFGESSVWQSGYELNNPFAVMEGRAKTISFAGTDRRNIVIETVKPSEDGSGDVILRLYEAAGMRTSARLTVEMKGRVSETDLLENPLSAGTPFEGILDLTFSPFEIRTFRISKTKKDINE